MAERVCVVDDDRASREAMVDLLRKDGYEVLAAANGEEFLEHLAAQDLDLVLTDLIMPGLSGLALLARCLEADPDLQVVMITGYGTVETAVKAMQDGAFHYLTKPIKAAELREVVRKALTVRRLRLENRALHDRVDEKFSLGGVVGASPAMQRVLELVRKVAPTRSTVLITGESGTGKELIANCLHQNSRRAAGPYVKVNCAAIVESLLESELFGHVQGAFTGAVRDKVGRFQAADGGTILLDEIGELSLPTQTKLLRVLQESEIERVGEVRPIKLDVRVLAASNRDLAESVRQRTFREDLYYRLKVVTVHLPPLRERLEDLPLFVRTFVDDLAREHGVRVKGVTPRALEALRRHRWPGNVRELRNVLEGIVVTTTHELIDLEDLPPDLAPSAPVGRLAVPVGVSLEDVEREMIRRTLESTDGNRTRAARILGLSLRTLQRKLRVLLGDDEA